MQHRVTKWRRCKENMALLRDVIFRAGPKFLDLIAAESKKINLKPVNKITIKFDPFRDDVSHIRKFSYLIHDQQILHTNQRCIIKTEILSDRSEHTITFDLANGKQFIFNCGNLKCLEIFRLINQHITPLAPKEEAVSVAGTKPIGKGKKK